MNFSKLCYYGFKVINIAAVGIAVKEYFFDISIKIVY